MLHLSQFCRCLRALAAKMYGLGRICWLCNMATKLFDRVLITNDDGIDAEGIKALERAAGKVAEEVWVVAPEQDASGSSAGLNLRKPIRTHQISERKFAISGTPSDCILMAYRYIMEGKPPTMIMSGINCGANLADDLLFSGTTNAALVGAFLGISSIAFSQAYHSLSDLHWTTSETLVPVVLEKLHKAGWPRGAAFNVNFPAAPLDKITGVEIARMGGGSLLAVEVEPAVEQMEGSHYRLGTTPKKRDHHADTDVASLRRLAVSVTPLKLDRTDHDLLDSLHQKFSDASNLPKNAVTG
jgi:5'-nucleotidase